MSFLWDLMQDDRIRHASTEASEASASADQTHLLLAHTERKLARLSQLTEALWNLLKSRDGFTDAELLAEVARLNPARDAGGAAQRRSDPLPCHACGRVLPLASTRCLYCGAESGASAPFAGL